MPLPSILTYNELDGSEVSLILQGRFQQILAAVPYLQRHLTLPRVRMKLEVTLEVWADQPTPDILKINDRVEVKVDGPEAEAAELIETVEATSIDIAAPIEGGHPPGEIRAMHGLAIPTPGPGARNVGGHIATADHAAVLEGQEVEGRPGLTVSRTGTGMIGGELAGPRGATVAKIDQGPAGLRSGNMNRENWNFGRKK